MTQMRRDRPICSWLESSNYGVSAANRTNAVIGTIDMPTEVVPSAVDLSLEITSARAEYLAISKGEMTA